MSSQNESFDQYGSTTVEEYLQQQCDFQIEKIRSHMEEQIEKLRQKHRDSIKDLKEAFENTPPTPAKLKHIR